MVRQSITTAQAAEMLGVSPQTVQKWVDAGHLDAWRTVGGHRRVDEASVLKMLREREESLQVVSSTEAPLTVLIVEDNELQAQVLKVQVMDTLPDAEVTLIHSAFSALIAMGRDVPDLLITDIAMPGIDGLAMLRLLSEHPRTRSMPTVLVSAYSPEELVAVGPVPVEFPLLHKPVSDAALQAALRRVLPKHRVRPLAAA